MVNPSPIAIPEKAWLKIDSGQIFGTLYEMDTSFTYYKTYRQVGDTAPDDSIVPGNPLFDGVKIFTESREESFSFGNKVDLYIYCANSDDDAADSGMVIYFKDEDKRSKKNVDVFIQDQTTPFDDFYFVQQIGIPTTITADTVFDARAITVASIADISIGDYIFIFSGVSGEDRFYEGTVLGISVLTLTMDNLIDFVFTSGDTVISTSKDLNVDGSVTPQVFQIRAGGAGSELEIDITRIIMQNLSATAVDLSKFADIIGGLINGLMLREQINASTFKNKWNVKMNADFALFAYDWEPFAATNPAQGQDGFKWRYTISGQDKHGVAKRIGTDRSLQLIIQDDLTSLQSLFAIGANHEVD